MNRISAILIVIAILMVAQSAIASPDELHGCVKRNGVLRIDDTCGPKEKPLTWNQVGPQGPQGPQGASSAFRVLAGSQEFGPEDELRTRNQIVACPEGKVLGASAWLNLGWGDTIPVVANIYDPSHVEITWMTTDPGTVFWNVSCA